MKKWKKYCGEYEKAEYAVRTKDNTYSPCWPNAGNFYLLKDVGTCINGDSIEFIRKLEKSEKKH